MRTFLSLLLVGLLLACNPDLPNQNPSVQRFQAAPQTGIAPLQTAFNWSVQDPDGDLLTCQLDADGNGAFDYSLPCSAANQTHSYSTAGTYTAKLRATDARGGSAEAVVQVQVSPNQNPTISAFSPNPTSGNAPLATTFRWTIGDPNSDPLVCRLDIGNDGSFEYTLQNCTSASSQAHTFSAAGTYPVRLRVEDNRGGSAQQTTSVGVTQPAPTNRNPTLTQFVPTPSSGPAPLAVSFGWQIGDPDGDALTCRLDINNDGTPDYTLNNCSSTST